MTATSVSHGLPSERAPSVVSSSSKLTAQGQSTVSLTKRLLFPNLPPSSPPPPLLHTSSSYPALDAELYDFIALALRAYINPWWTKITRYDKQLLLELTRILTSVLRTIETRALAADLSPLLYLDLPALLAQHCADYRAATRKLGSSYAAAGSASLPVLFHGQQQHVGVSFDGKADEVYVRAAVDIVLRACLSPEDWDAQAERYLIREIIVKTVCIDLVPRITQPWFLHSTLLDLLGPPDEPLNPPDPPSRFQANASLLPSLPTMIVSFLSTVQTISSTALFLIQIYKRAVHTIKTVHNSPIHVPPQSPIRTRPSPHAPEALLPPSPSTPEIPSTPRDPSPSQTVATSISSEPNNPGSPPPTPPPPNRASLHNLARPTLLLLAELLSLPARFSGAALLFLCNALVSTFTPFLDRLLPLFLYTSVLTPVRITALISAAKHSLFPNGYPAQSPPDPTPDEQAVLRSELARRIAQAIPGPLAPLLLGSAAREQTMSALLDPFDEQACNAHLFMLLFDSALLSLFPEMAVGATDSAVGNQ